MDYTIAPDVRWPSGAPLGAADLARTWRERRDDRVLADLGYRDVRSVRRAVATTGVAGTVVAVTFAHPYADWESLFNLLVPAGTAGAACALPSAALDPAIGPYAIRSASRSRIVLTVNRRWTGATPAYTTVVVTSDPAALPPPPEVGARATYLPSPSVAQLQAHHVLGQLRVRDAARHDDRQPRLRRARPRRPRPLAPCRPRPPRGPRPAGRAPGRAPRCVERPGGLAPLRSRRGSSTRARRAPRSSATTPPAPTAAGATGAAAYGQGADLSRADALLRAHGYHLGSEGWTSSSGSRLTVCLALPAGSPTLAAAAEDVAGQLRDHGVVVRTAPVASTGAVVQRLLGGTCTMGVVSRTGDGFVSHAAASWLAPTRPVVRGLDWTGVDDPVVARDATEAQSILDPDLAAVAWDAMDTRLWDLMVSLPLYSPSVFLGWSPSIAGVLACNTVAGFVAQVPSLLPSTTRP